MAEVSSLPSSPSPAFDEPRERPSRPLSEISENEDKRRSKRSSRLLELEKIDRTDGKDKGRSRPTSEVHDENTPPVSAVPSGPTSPVVSQGGAKTLSINLLDYAAKQRQEAVGPSQRALGMALGSVSERVEKASNTPVDPLKQAGGHADPGDEAQTTGAAGQQTDMRLQTGHEFPLMSALESDNAETTTQFGREPVGSQGKSLPDTPEDQPRAPLPTTDGVSALYIAKRASLRPSPLGPSYADVLKPLVSPAMSSEDRTSSDSLRSSFEHLKSSSRSKPSWLRRASNTAAAGLRAKSRSPVSQEESTFSSSASDLPKPPLPDRKGKAPAIEAVDDASPATDDIGHAQSERRPELPPKRSSYAKVAAARSKLGEGQGQPAFLPPPPSHPSRENIGNIRGKIAAWTSAAGSTSSSFIRSSSSASLALSARSPPVASSSNFVPRQREYSGAQKMLGHAGSAVQKGWAGLRTRGVTGSISSLSQLGQSSRRGSSGPGGSMEVSSSWTSGLGRRSKDKAPLAEEELRDEPVWDEGVVKRAAGRRAGRVFGQPLIETGKTWGVEVASQEDDAGAGELDRLRRHCLPAIIVRTVDYLTIWGPKEEGIFRISGRSSHIARLRREFDAGADLDITNCHPGDLDPHAVAGVFKLYLRQLPHHLLTDELADQFELYDRKSDKDPADLDRLLHRLPPAHWFLLADIVKLLDLIPRHADVNRMTLHALRTSLGPSLNLPGNLADELVRRREELFSHPPDSTTFEAVNSLVDFGDSPIESPLASASLPTPRSVSPPPVDGSVKSKTKRIPPRIASKPSLQRLFSGSAALRATGSEESLRRSSVGEQAPPQVDLKISPTSPLPTFASEVTPSSAHSLLSPDESSQISSGTVKDRRKLFSEAAARKDAPIATPTPIADKFQNSSPVFPPLRQPKSSIGSMSSSASVPVLATFDGKSDHQNPATIIRRGQPVFFQSGGPKHNRSTSAVSLKRKEDGENLVEELEDGTRAKRLSAGMGMSASGATVRDAVRAMEMTA